MSYLVLSLLPPVNELGSHSNGLKIVLAPSLTQNSKVNPLSAYLVFFALTHMMDLVGTHNKSFDLVSRSSLIPISTSIMAFVPTSKENGVYPLVFLLVL